MRQIWSLRSPALRSILRYRLKFTSLGPISDSEIPFEGLIRSDARQTCILSPTSVSCCSARKMVLAKKCFASGGSGWAIGDGDEEEASIRPVTTCEEVKDFAEQRCCLKACELPEDLAGERLCLTALEVSENLAGER